MNNPLPETPDMRPVLRFDRPVSAEAARQVAAHYPSRRPTSPPSANRSQRPNRPSAPPPSVNPKRRPSPAGDRHDEGRTTDYLPPRNYMPPSERRPVRSVHAEQPRRLTPENDPPPSVSRLQRPVSAEDERRANANYLPQRNYMPQTANRPPRPAPMEQPRRQAAENVPPSRPVAPQTVNRPPRPAPIEQPRRQSPLQTASRPERPAPMEQPRRQSPPQTASRPERPAPMEQPRRQAPPQTVGRPAPREAVPSGKRKETFSVVKAAAGLAAAAALVVMTTVTIRRGGHMGLKLFAKGGVVGGEDQTFQLVDTEQIETQELAGKEFVYSFLDEGSLKYKFKSVTAYDNVYSLCGEELKEHLDNPGQFSLRDSGWGLAFSDDGSIPYEGYTRRGVTRSGETATVYRYPEVFDADTGQLKFNSHIFVFEIDITNIDHVGDTTVPSIQNPDQFIVDNFTLVNRSNSQLDPDNGLVLAALCYLKGGVPKEDGEIGNVGECKQGETKTMRLGYFFPGDESEKPYSRIGLTADTSFSEYDENEMQLWFDLTDALAKMGE